MAGPPRRLLGVFVDQALEGLAAIAEYIEGGGEEKASIDRAFRCAHSLAENSRLLGCDRTAASADALEGALLTCRNTTRHLDSETAAAMLVDVHALPIVIREELRRSFSLDSIEPLDGRIKEIRDLVDKAVRTDKPGRA
jgi:HPt (histidine-containing phosphotransfer) domain-containing protein